MTNKINQFRNAMPAGCVLQEFQLLRVLGAGGFGITYLAMDTILLQEVAIKEYFPNQYAIREGQSVHPRDSAKLGDFKYGLDCFLQEARTLASFQHRNLVQVRRFFEANHTAYMVMQFEDGQDLEDMITGGQQLDEAAILAIVLPLLDVLEMVHAEGVLHRDIKPANIYMRSEDNSPVLIDFGASRHAIGGRSNNLERIVAPGYSPLEKYYDSDEEGGKQEVYTDIYSLGAVCYRLITGETPPSAFSRASAQLNGKPDPLQTLSGSWPAYRKGLLDAIDHSLLLKREARPKCVQDWRLELSPLPPPIPGERPWKRLAGILLLVTVLAGAYVGWRQRKEMQSTALLTSFESAVEANEFAKAVTYLQQLKDLKLPKGRYVTIKNSACTRLLLAFSAKGKSLEREGKYDKALEQYTFAKKVNQMAELNQQEVVNGLIAGVEEKISLAGDFVSIPQGCFQMGCTVGDSTCWDQEELAHEVCLEAFQMGRHEVTVGEFKKFVEATGYRTEAEVEGWCYREEDPSIKSNNGLNWKNPGFSQTEEEPVVCTSWNDAGHYARWLGAKTGKSYRLPTEAEWEYGARAGTKSEQHWTDDDKACDYANVFDLTSKHTFTDRNVDAFDCTDGYVHTAPVGKFKANSFGLYDMLGNVSEWCNDWHDKDYFQTGPRDNPSGPSTGYFRVYRGASWHSLRGEFQLSERRSWSPELRKVNLGFRLVLPPEESQ